MKFREVLVTAVAAVTIGWVAHSAFSDDKPTDGAGVDASNGMTSPGEEHARLAWFAGEWTAKGKFWFGPDPTEATNTTASTMIMGGRYLVEDMKSTMRGQPFEGRATYGYDVLEKKWWATWIDSFGTGLMTFTGRETEKGKAWEYVSEADAKGMSMRLVHKVTGEKTWTKEMFIKSAEGEMKFAVVDYTKK